MINKNNLPCQELKGKKLYHYTSFDSFVKIWLSKKILLCSIENVNDILEYKHTLEVNNLCCLPLTLAFDEVRKSFRQTSFTLDDDQMEGFKNPMMWGQYANKAKGVCIEFDFDKLFLKYKDNRDVLDGFVRYLDRIPKLPPINGQRTKNDIRDYIINYKDSIMFTKYNVWETENEYRIVSDKLSELDIEGTISAVYLASCLSDECLFVEELLKESEVPVWALLITTNTLFSQLEVCNPKERRKKIKETDNINSQVNDFYQSCKDDDDACLIMNCIKLGECK